MRKTFYGEQPLAVETKTVGKYKYIFIRENITEIEKVVEGETVTEWSADEYTRKVPSNVEVTESVIADIKTTDRAAAAKAVRAKRDALLAQSDSQMITDRPTDKEAWAAYRQALRDITAQPGFPYDVAFPELPK